MATDFRGEQSLEGGRHRLPSSLLSNLRERAMAPRVMTAVKAGGASRVRERQEGNGRREVPRLLERKKL
jgi:hypothetical protein